MLTPEQEARAAAEDNGSDFYSDERPKYHRHFAESGIHVDADCTKHSRRIRVYVFDTEDLENHEAFIANRVKQQAYDTVEQINTALRKAIRDLG